MHGRKENSKDARKSYLNLLAMLISEEIIDELGLLDESSTVDTALDTNYDKDRKEDNDET